jgi:hypothetical protein
VRASISSWRPQSAKLPSHGRLGRGSSGYRDAILNSPAQWTRRPQNSETVKCVGLTPYSIRPTDGGETRVLAELFGGQGTPNVPSWSPDSRRLAFVSYRLTNP